MNDPSEQTSDLALEFNVSINLLEQSADSIALVNQSGRILFVNSETEKLFGYNRAELVDEPLTTLVPERFHFRHLSMCRQYFETPEKREMRPLHLDAFGLRKDRTEFPVQVVLAPLKTSQGLVAITTIRDLSERRATESALRDSERKYRELIKAANDAIFMFYLDSGAVSEANQQAGHLIGRSPNNIIGLRLFDLFPPREIEYVERLFTEFAHRGRGKAKDLHVVHREGRLIPVEISTSVLEINGRQLMQGIFRDVSEDKAVEETLATKARQQAVVAEIGREALTETDMQKLMNAIVTRTAETLDIEYAMILELRPEENLLRPRAGFGWKPGWQERTLTADVRSQAGYTIVSERPAIMEDLKMETRFQSAFLSDHGAISGMSVIVKGEEAPYGVLEAHTKTRRTFTQDDVNFLQAIANVLAGALDRTRDEEALRTKDLEIRQAYVEVLFAVTGGKLVIVTEDELPENIGRPVGEPFNIYAYKDLGRARDILRKTISTEFAGDLDLGEIITATGEAMTNAIKHSGGGEVQVFRADNVLQIMIKDSGPGIDFSLLPRATLMSGFSTKQTLGIGFTIMLEFCDRLLLSTKPGGTTVVLEVSGLAGGSKAEDDHPSPVTPELP